MSRLILPAVFTALLSSPALAITCHGDYQVVGGQEISTPYCRDGSLAAAARASGFHVSDATVRTNTEKKTELCRYLNNDIRAQPACDDVLPNGDSD
jgi:hypothetical protein